ncbi:VOC family protein [Chloroflexota bacterium]
MPDYWLDHIHLVSSEPKKTAEFYKKMFGAIWVNTLDLGEGRVIVKLDLNGIGILVTQRMSDDGQNGLVHFGIGTDNLAKAVDDLEAEGVKFTQGIREVRPGLKISFLLAPEDVSVELQEGSI